MKIAEYVSKITSLLITEPLLMLALAAFALVAFALYVVLRAIERRQW